MIIKCTRDEAWELLINCVKAKGCEGCALNNLCKKAGRAIDLEKMCEEVKQK